MTLAYGKPIAGPLRANKQLEEGAGTLSAYSLTAGSPAGVPDARTIVRFHDRAPGRRAPLRDDTSTRIGSDITLTPDETVILDPADLEYTEGLYLQVVQGIIASGQYREDDDLDEDVLTGAAAALISTATSSHVAAADPHADRAYTDTEVAAEATARATAISSATSLASLEAKLDGTYSRTGRTVTSIELTTSDDLDAAIAALEGTQTEIILAPGDHARSAVLNIPAGTRLFARPGARLLVTGDVVGAVRGFGAGYADPLTDVHLEGVTVEFTAPASGNQQAFYFQYLNNARIVGCRATTPDNNGLNLYYSSDVTIEDFFVDTPDDYGIFVYQSKDTSIRNPNLRDGRRLIVVKGSYDAEEYLGVEIIGGLLDGYEDYGIASADLGAEGDLRGLTVVGTRIRNGGVAGKGVYVGPNGINYQFLGVRMRDPGSGGYDLNGGTGHSLLGGDVRFASAGAAPGISSSTDHLKVHDVEVEGASTGIYVSGTDHASIIGNRVKGCSGVSIHVNNSGSAGANSYALVTKNKTTGGTRGVYEEGTGTLNAIYDNDSRDASTANLVRSQIVMPPTNGLSIAADTTWPAANAAILSRFTLHEPTPLRYFLWRIGTASGNVQMGVVRLNSIGNAYTRVMNSGVIACPAAAAIRYDLGSTTLPPGEYAMFFWADNTTVAVPHTSHNVATAMRTSAVITDAAGLPASGSVSWGASGRYLAGACMEAA